MTSFNTNSLGLNVLVGANSRVSTDYTFDVASGFLTVNERDFKQLLFVENKESGKLLYQIFKPELGGKTSGGGTVLNASTAGMNDNDDLVVVYEALSNTQDIRELNCTMLDVLNELKIVNKNLRLIRS